MWSFLSCCYRVILSRLFILLQGWSLVFFFITKNHFLDEYTIFYLFIHRHMGVWVIFTFGPWWRLLLWTCPVHTLWMFFFTCLGHTPTNGTSRMVSLILWRAARCLPVQLLHSQHQSAYEASGSLSLHQYLVFLLSLVLLMLGGLGFFFFPSARDQTPDPKCWPSFYVIFV